MDDWDDDWGYNDDTTHNMWVDHTTEVYESDNEDTGWSWMAPAPSYGHSSRRRENRLTDEQKLEKTAANLLLINEEIEELESVFQANPSKKQRKRVEDAHMRRRRLIEYREELKRDQAKKEQSQRNYQAQRIKELTALFGFMFLLMVIVGLWMLFG